MADTGNRFVCPLYYRAFSYGSAAGAVAALATTGYQFYLTSDPHPPPRDRSIALCHGLRCTFVRFTLPAVVHAGEQPDIVRSAMAPTAAWRNLV